MGRPGVAAFDFDGTLARRDTFVPFLGFACGWHKVVVTGAAAAVRDRDRDKLKVTMVGRLFRGWTSSRLADVGASYAERLPDLLRPELVDRVAWHRAEGHAIVIVSAGLDVYLKPVAARLGIDDVLAVELVADETGRLTGAVHGDVNNRGPQKVARLQAWTEQRFGPDQDVELWAYGDSSGDEELLAAAEHPQWVGKRAARNA